MSSAPAADLDRSSRRGGGIAVLAAVAGLCIAAVLGFLVAVRPGLGLALAGGILALTFVLAVVLEKRAALAFVPVLALTGIGTAMLWPTLTVGIAAFLVLVLLLRHSPGYAFLLALLLIGLEGTIKLRLMLEGAPSPRGLGAGLLDLAFGVAVLALLAHDRGRTVRLVWERASRFERIAFSLVLAWFVVSIFQIPQGGDIVNGVEGFRLMQAYFLAVFAGMVLLRVTASTERLTDLFLVVLLALSGYAALRTATGPSGEETSFALLRTNQASFGDSGRGIGSFSSVVGLATFLAPAGVFGLVLGFLHKRHRVLAWPMAALAAVGVVGSYVRTALVAMVAGTVVLAGILIGGRNVPRPMRVIAICMIFVVAGGCYVAAQSTSDVSDLTERRAAGLRDPLKDESLDERFDTWGRSLDTIADNPFGTGVGTVGHATFTRGTDRAMTDNNYLKVTQEQGILVGLAFTLGLLGLCISLVRRFARGDPLRYPIGVAALAAFVGFLVLAVMGESFEQPGKVLAWTFLGIAISSAFLGADLRPAGPRRAESLPSRVRASGRALTGTLRQTVSAVPRWQRITAVAVVCLMALVPAALTFFRQAQFESSIEAFAAPAGPAADVVPPRQLRAYVDEQVHKKLIGATVARAVNFALDPGDVPGKVTVVPGGAPHTVLVRASDGSPERATAIVVHVAPIASSRSDLDQLDPRALIDQRLQELIERGKSPDLGRAERAAIRRRFQALAELRAGDPSLSVRFSKQAPAVEEPTKALDKLVDRLPGSFPRRPSAAWAGLAGLTLAMALLALCLTFVSRGQAPAQSGPGHNRPAADPPGIS